MIYADYDFYKEQFCGRTIPQDDFRYFAARASEHIDAATFGRLENDIPEEHAEKIQSCCCALAETEYRFDQRSDISSEKNGSYSVTYSAKSSDSHSVDMNRIIARYLGSTGLLYRGVD